MRIVGAGFAEPDVNRGWADALAYEYELWTDTEQVLAAHYDVLDPAEELPLRHAYILEPDGAAVLFHEGAVSVGADPGRVLEDCRLLFGS